MKIWYVVHRIIGILLILVGLTFYVFSAPGSTLLVVLGFVWLVGKNKTLLFLRKILGEKIFKSLKEKDILNKV